MRNQERSARLTQLAALLAATPVERVDRQLRNLADQYEHERRQILSPPPEPASLTSARNLERHLTSLVVEARTALILAEAEYKNLLSKQPIGLRAWIDGSKVRWEEQASAAKIHCSKLRANYEDVKDKFDRARDGRSFLERVEESKHRRSIREPINVDRVNRLREGISKVERARLLLGKNPALAWGGVAMLMAAIGAAPSQKFPDDEVEKEPPSGLLAETDLWGIGILPKR